MGSGRPGEWERRKRLGKEDGSQGPVSSLCFLQLCWQQPQATQQLLGKAQEEGGKAEWGTPTPHTPQGNVKPDSPHWERAGP